MISDKPALIAAHHITRTFRSSEGQELVVINDVNFEIREGEIVALLGKSGAGKSTLMRIVAGLLKPTKGEVYHQGRRVDGPIKQAAMVFQSFALLPWLTVLQNVELGLEAMGLPHAECRSRAIKAIDTIGLDGFESAYPKELSGGMRQRVGLARALVIEPELLLMDEPFSALDVLTAENLRGDMIDLWLDKRTRTKAMLFVTHNIEEAALLADRIIIVSSDPGEIRAELAVNMSLPRDPSTPAFRHIVDQIYTLMTTAKKDVRVRIEDSGTELERIDIGYRLPDAEVSELTGLVDAIWQAAADAEGPVDLPFIAESLHMDADKLFPLTETLAILSLAKVSQGDIILTDIGVKFANADILERKRMFATQLRSRVPLAKYIRDTLDTHVDHIVSEDTILSALEAYLTDDEAERVLKVMIDWGRYAEIFAYDYDTGDLSLENPSSDE